MKLDEISVIIRFKINVEAILFIKISERTMKWKWNENQTMTKHFDINLSDVFHKD